MKKAYTFVGFRLIYLECEDKPKLRRFYESHGFDLHADSKGKPFRNDDKSDLIIYLASSSLLDKIK